MNVIYLNCSEIYVDLVDHHRYCIRTHDLCDTGAVLYQLSYQAIWELVTLLIHNIPVDGEECE